MCDYEFPHESMPYYGGTGSTIVDLKALSASPLTLVYRNQFTVHVHDQLKATAAHRHADDAPAAEVEQALVSAQEDLRGKTREAERLAAKVGMLEKAISQLM